MKKRIVNDFFDNEYKDYAREVVFKRAMPLMIDGFKESGRKIFYYMSKNKNKNIKVSAIAGGIIEKCDYHHSETSAQDTIINLSKFYEGSNNLPIAIPDGHFGSKINSGSASARYIFASYNSLMDYIFLDEELTESDIFSESPEPINFLPIVPMNVINGCNGVAIGYAVNILPHNPLDIIVFMLDVLQKKNTKKLQPYFHGCDYEYNRIDNSNFEIFSNSLKFKKDKIVVTELKPDMDREKFTKILIKLQETGLIKSFKDESKEQFKFIIKNIKLTEEDVYQKLNLISNYYQNINLIKDNTVLTYPNVEAFIYDFTANRLTYYSKRKEYMKDHYKHLIALNDGLCCFIDNKSGLFNNRKDVIQFFLEKGINQEIINICLSKPISALNKESLEKLKKENETYQEKINFYDKIDESKLYIKDLKILRKEIIKFYEKYDKVLSVSKK